MYICTSHLIHVNVFILLHLVVIFSYYKGHCRLFFLDNIKGRKIALFFYCYFFSCFGINCSTPYKPINTTLIRVSLVQQLRQGARARLPGWKPGVPRFFVLHVPDLRMQMIVIFTFQSCFKDKLIRYLKHLDLYLACSEYILSFRCSYPCEQNHILKIKLSYSVSL